MEWEGFIIEARRRERAGSLFELEKQTLRFGSKIAMAARIAARYVARRLSSGGKVLSEEEKAAENVYIKVLPTSLDLSLVLISFLVSFL